jgi:methyl-accepting chemotaxis protein
LYVEKVANIVKEIQSNLRQLNIEIKEVDDYYNEFLSLVEQKATFNDYEKRLVPIARNAGDRIDTFVTGIKQETKSSLRLSAIITFISSLFLLALFVFVFGQINKSSKILKKREEEIHSNAMNLALNITDYMNIITTLSKGDLNVSVQENSDDELFNQLGKSTNKMIAGMKELTESAEKIANGNLDAVINVRSDQDILSKTFLKMQTNLRLNMDELHKTTMNLAMNLTDYLGIMTALSQGDLNVSVSENTGDELFDQLGKNTNQMISSMKELTESAEKIASGNLDVSVKVRSEKDTLSKTFLKMQVHLKSTMDELHRTTMNLAMNLTDYLNIMTSLSQGDLNISASEHTGDELFDQLGKNTNQMISSLKELSNSAEKISTGDLSVEIKIRSEKDILAKSFVLMVTNLKKIVKEVKTSTGTIARSAEGLAQITEQATQSISQVSNVVSQISSSTNQVAQSAQAASHSGQTANQSVVAGKDMMDKLNHQIITIDKDVKDIVSVITDLSKKSNRISEIVNVILKITDQTNLLSLNAAIEAARAGEAGRGFAVVADEVRKLAESSAVSADEIKQILASVLDTTKQSVDAATVGLKRVDEGMSVMKDVQGKFNEIFEFIRASTEQVEQIAAATEETSASTEEVSSTMEEQNAAIEEISAQSSTLANTAVELRNQVTKFKTE